MTSCLGIYLSNNIVKYAKLISDNKEYKLEAYGVRFVKDNQIDTLKNIIEETNSKNIPVVMNPQNDKYINYQMFDQVQNNKAISNDIAKMEFDAWCEKNAKSPDKYSFVHRVSQVKNSENKFNAVLDFVEKKYLEEYTEKTDIKITNIFPAPLLMDRLVPHNEKNYILVNLDDQLSVCAILDGKLVDIKFYDTGMRQILNDFSIKLGSYQKAYEACKQLNVYSDDNDTNNKELEGIAEPILQDILRNVAGISSRYKKDVDKVILTGNGIVFTNIDILFREYLDIKCEILKPDFVQMSGNIRNLAEVLETTQAIALAYEVLSPQRGELAFLNSAAKLKKEFNSLFAKKPKQEKKQKAEKTAKESKNSVKEKISSLGIEEDKTFKVAVCSSIVLGLILVSYIVFSSLFMTNVNKTLKTIEGNKQEIETASKEVMSDITYINNNKSKYKEINDEVSNIVQQIENNQIGHFTTYNVASFLQNIIKIIPRNVQLKTISSDDNKNVKITAQSSSYAELGYFVAELKINGTLKNVKINNIKNGETTVIEIGGELP